jgi:hypothetical protein
MVLDESNSFVEGVKQSDIELSENGVKQKITYFAERSSGFYVAFVVDNSGSLREHLEKITTICKMIALNLGPADEAFVIRFVGRDKIEVAQDFTSDKEKLFATFEKVDNQLSLTRFMLPSRSSLNSKKLLRPNALP